MVVAVVIVEMAVASVVVVVVVVVRLGDVRQKTNRPGCVLLVKNMRLTESLDD